MYPPKITTDGLPAAAAMCIGPESGPTWISAAAMAAASSGRVVRPRRSTAISSFAVVDAGAPISISVDHFAWARQVSPTLSELFHEVLSKNATWANIRHLYTKVVADDLRKVSMNRMDVFVGQLDCSGRFRRIAGDNFVDKGQAPNEVDVVRVKYDVAMRVQPLNFSKGRRTHQDVSQSRAASHSEDVLLCRRNPRYWMANPPAPEAGVFRQRPHNSAK